LNYGHIF